MEKVRNIVVLALAERNKAGIKVRQPLLELRIKNFELEKEKELLKLIEEEVNVKKITFGKTLKLNTKITPELKEEGLIREIVRQIQDMRKKTGLKPQDEILVKYSGENNLKNVLEKNKNLIMKEGRIKEVLEEALSPDPGKEISIDGKKLFLAIKKIKSD